MQTTFNRCLICGRYAECSHHLIFGISQRKLCDEDELTIPLCNSCHNMGKHSIHGNVAAEHLSKMLGQALYEQKGTREDFIKRYGRSYL